MVISAHSKVQEFVTGLVDATRTSYELEVILNHNPEGEPWQVKIINITGITIIGYLSNFATGSLKFPFF